MPFMIFALDKPDAEDGLRAALKPEHLAYLQARQNDILAAGALLDDKGKAIGGLLLVDTEDREQAQRFAGADPFSTGGLFGSIQILAWRKSFFDRSYTP